MDTPTPLLSIDPDGLAGWVRWVDRSEPALLVAVDHASEASRSFVGRSVRVPLDPARTTFRIGDRNGDGAHDLGDVRLGDRVRFDGGRAVVH
jgi:hypothetical protein